MDNRFKFQPYICNGCHDVLIMSMNLDDIAILNINGADYRCVIAGTSKTEVINLMQNIDFSEKKKQKIIKYKKNYFHI